MEEAFQRVLQRHPNLVFPMKQEEWEQLTTDEFILSLTDYEYASLIDKQFPLTSENLEYLERFL